MKTLLLLFTLALSAALPAQSYTEGNDLPSTGTGPAFTLAGSGITIAGVLNTPADAQDRFQIIVPVGYTITSVTYVVSDTANIGANGHAQFGMMNQQAVPPLSGSFAAGPWGPFPVGPGTYDCMFVMNVAANDHWSMVFNASQTTAIEEEKFFAAVNIFPNPAAEEMTVTLSGPEKNAALELRNTLGQIVASHALTAGENRFDLSALAEGVYVYRVIAAGIPGERGKLVVQR